MIRLELRGYKINDIVESLVSLNSLKSSVVDFLQLELKRTLGHLTLPLAH